MENGRRPTLKDIAAKTGFSINTVSRALRNKNDISAATREQIRRVSQEMGYVNNTLASALRLGYTKMLALIIPDVCNLFFSCAMEEIQRGAREYGYSTVLLNTSENGEYEYRAIRTALSKHVDGVIFSPVQSSLDNTEFLLATGTPFVLFARFFEGMDTDYVVGDDEMGGYQAAMHLIENGHRNILFLNGTSSFNSSAQGREQGYRRAHKEAGIPVQESLVREVAIKGDDSVRTAAEILAARSDITAVFTFNDMMAMELYDHLLGRGYRVPEDISIVGFDSLCTSLHIPLHITSVDNDKSRMAAMTLNALIAKLQNENPREVICRETLKTTLVRGTTVRKL